jgi:hypothetical protein
MTVNPLNGAYDAREAVLGGIQERYVTRGFWTPNLKKTTLPLDVCAPHRVAFLHLDEVLSRTRGPEPEPPSPENATQILRASASVLGWRFLVYKKSDHAPDELLAAAHAVIDPRTGGYRLAELNEGQYVKGVLDAFRRARAKFKERIPFDFDVLLLVVPSIFTAAMWLRNTRIPDSNDIKPGDSPESDYLIPIRPVHDFRELDVLVPGQFFDRLRNVKPAEDDPEDDDSD